MPQTWTQLHFGQWIMWILTHSTDFQGEKKRNKNNKMLVRVGHKREERRERPSTDLPWSLGILSEESANRPSTGGEKTRARITSFEGGTSRIFKGKKIKPHKLPNKSSLSFSANRKEIHTWFPHFHRLSPQLTLFLGSLCSVLYLHCLI